MSRRAPAPGIPARGGEIAAPQGARAAVEERRRDRAAVTYQVRLWLLWQLALQLVPFHVPEMTVPE